MKSSAKVIPISRKASVSNTSRKKAKPKDMERILREADSALSSFSKRHKELQRGVDSKAEQTIPVIQRELLKSLMELVPIAEKTYKESKRQGDVYGYNSLISQIRETIADIQATKDTQQLLDRIIINILQPQFMSMAQFLIDSHYGVVRSLKPKIGAEHRKELTSVVNASSKAVARHMDECFHEIKQRLQREFE